MKRHSIIARLGPADTAKVPVLQKDSLATPIHFIDGQQRLGFGIGQMVDQLVKRGIVPSETALDLALLAAVITAADTRIARATDAQDGWTREIDLYIPVSETNRWAELSQDLTRTLKFLTGDHWRLFFRERPSEYATLITAARPLMGPTFTSVCLFSGGLDSFVGAIDLLAAGGDPLFVSHYGDNSTKTQPKCAQHLASVYGDIDARHVRANVRFDKNDFPHNMGSESSTRGRSFLFFSLAALAASGLDNPVFNVPENGLISLNVPLDRLRLGSWSTRTTHPFYMARWQTTLDKLGIRARLDNPYRFMTKGEMLAACNNQKLIRRGAGDTTSCSSVTKQRFKKGNKLGHCGYCVPCLIRRSAIAFAFGDDSTAYQYQDLKKRPIDSEKAEGEHIRSFQMMARRLKSRTGIERILVHKSGPLSDYSPPEISDYANVFKRGIVEVDTLTGPIVVKRQ